ncbi:hypothetical protein HFN78_30825 [Rhizobium laguerreae]|uniref:hypothetical protein n=1 Tax=Rhizobium laguerreae TaxID=1076926 RepID=UPI001C90C531|nr:hypothetical protein [Rhizobium laguerreae]MBY3475262.1 hypothetical protein [Rhizobium laguerreae]
MTDRPNNPRAFAEVVSIDVSRTPYANGTGEADLHIDVGFFEGRLGADALAGSPVRFRLSLKRAEIHVFRDQANIIEIPASSVAREALVASKAKTTTTQSRSIKGAVKAALANGKPRLDLDLDAKGGTEITKRIEKDEDLGEMRIAHRKMPDGGGYVFTIQPATSRTLDGSAWDPAAPRMKLRDTKAGRKRGDPPEVTVQIHCRREDLHIEDPTIVDATVWNGGLLSRNKQIAVEQYIKKEVLAMGLPCGDLSDSFATVILADAVSVEER